MRSAYGYAAEFINARQKGMITAPVPSLHPVGRLLRRLASGFFHPRRLGHHHRRLAWMKPLFHGGMLSGYVVPAEACYVSIPHRIQSSLPPPWPSTTRPVTHASFIPLEGVRLPITNHSRPSNTPVPSIVIYLSLTYDRPRLNLLPISPCRMRPRCAISTNSGYRNTFTTCSTGSRPSYPLRVLRRCWLIEDPARPTLLPVLVGKPFVQNRYKG
jgi:hypothetical protein